MSDDVDITQKKIGPWRRLSQFEIYDNPWIRLTHEEVITPGQTEGIYGVVHFKNFALGIVALDADHNTWLVGQHRYMLSKSFTKAQIKKNITRLEQFHTRAERAHDKMCVAQNHIKDIFSGGSGSL